MAINKKNHLYTLICFFFSSALVGCAIEDAAAQPETIKPSLTNNLILVEQTFKERLEKYKDNDDIMVCRGLIADRKTKKITIQGQSTGIKGGETAEFFLIAEDSGNDYEAAAITFAKPSDIHKALLFIGAEQGRDVNIKDMQFWPKGERLLLTLRPDPALKLNFKSVRIERMIMNIRTEKSLSESGFIFIGSKYIEKKDAPGKKFYSADISDPKSVVSNYNEPYSVLSVSYPATQNEVYNIQRMNKEYVIPAEGFFEIDIEPEYKDGKKRVKDLALRMQNPENEAGSGIDKVVFQLKDKDGRILNKKSDMNSILALFVSIVKDGHDPCVLLKFDDKLTIETISQLCGILSSIETQSGIRVEAPPEGHIYYKAFTPVEDQRDRANRIVQPWELYLSSTDSGVTGKFTIVEEIWPEDLSILKPDLNPVDIEVPDPETLLKEMKKGLEAKRAKDIPAPGAIFVFIDKSIAYGELLRFLKPVLPIQSIIYVYLNEQAEIRE
jgi:hypothetical protein